MSRLRRLRSRARLRVRAALGAAVVATSCLTVATGITAAPPAYAASVPADGWHVTVYYTAVESLHHDRLVRVRGCRVLDCAHGRAALGAFPRSFVRAVRAEGTGRITSGRYRGRYLEWSSDVGYWIDRVPRDSYGGRLRPFVSAAADPSALRRGSALRVTGCGRDTDSGDAIDAGACARLRAAHWKVQDEFTPGLGGTHHVDLYIGEERGLHFTARSPLYLDASGAQLDVAGASTPAVAAPDTPDSPDAPAPAATSTSASPAPSSPAGISDDFASYAPTSWQPGDPRGPWQVVWTGYGDVTPGASGLRLAPAAASAADETHSTLVTSSGSLGDLDATWTYRTVSQLRTGSAPNQWEVGWVLWHYTDNTHFYYLLLKTDGWELGKEDPAYPGAQRFLATGAGSFPIGSDYTVRVQQRGATIAVDVDGQPLVSFTDDERPYLSGSVAMYDEDSVTDFRRVTATAL